MKTFHYSLTYEYDGTIEPSHIKGDIPATSEATAAGRAFRAARKAFKGRKPASIVLVIEQRRD